MVALVMGGCWYTNYGTMCYGWIVMVWHGMAWNSMAWHSVLSIDGRISEFMVSCLVSLRLRTYRRSIVYAFVVLTAVLCLRNLGISIVFTHLLSLVLRVRYISCF